MAVRSEKNKQNLCLLDSSQTPGEHKRPLVCLQIDSQTLQLFISSGLNGKSQTGSIIFINEETQLISLAKEPSVSSSISGDIIKEWMWLSALLKAEMISFLKVISKLHCQFFWESYDCLNFVKIFPFRALIKTRFNNLKVSLLQKKQQKFNILSRAFTFIIRLYVQNII